MHRDQLKPNVILRGPLFPEPVQVIVAVAMGEAVKVIAKGLRTGQVHEPVLNSEQLAQLEASPEKEPFDGDPLITRIKGYRGRGQLNEGVPLRKGVSTLRSCATEPNMQATLPWLDSTNDDDRLLARFLELMRRFPHSAVILVTRDINLQNKAELAQVCCLEPPALPKVVP